MPDVKFSNLYPYTDFHELNLDWVIKEVKFWSERVGKSIQKIELTGTVGLVDTYTITYSDGSTSTFDVTNGNGIASVAKTGTAGLVDTYTITFQDGSTTTFEVHNGTASIDPTLSLSDYAADAKVVGDDLARVNDDISTTNALFTHVNIYNPDDPDMVLGQFIMPDGSVNNGPTWCYSIIDVIPDAKIAFRLGVNNNKRVITCYYDANGDVVSGGSDMYSSTVKTIPSGAVKMSVSTAQTDRDTVTISYSGWQYMPVTPYDVQKPSENLILDGVTVLTADNSNLRQVLESISDSSQYNRYLVLLSPGTYNISTMYTSTEISQPGFYGLFVPPFVTLLGVGNREDIYIKWETIGIYNYVAPLNLYASSSLINLTVYGKNCRYCIHDDWTDTGYDYPDDYRFIRTIANCDFIADGTYLGAAYGAGTRSGTTWHFDNCKFESTDNNPCFYLHNQLGFTQPSVVEFNNCRFITTSASAISANFMSLNTGTTIDNILIFKGCKTTKQIRLGEDNAGVYGPGIRFKVTGYANDIPNVAITNTDGIDYSGNVDLI